MVSLFCYFLPMLLGNQSLITCLISMREEPVFLSFFRLVLSPCSPDSVSLGQSVLFGLLLSKGRTFLFFFSPGFISLVQSVLFGLLLSQSRTFLFFSPGSVSLGQSVLFGLLLSQGRTFLFFLFIWLCLSWGVCSFQTRLYLITN